MAQPKLCKEKQMEGPVNCTDSELSIYLRGLEEGYLATSCSDTNACVRSKLNPIASKSCLQGKQTVVFRGFPYLQMCASSTGDRGEDSSMSSRVGFHARTFRQQDAATASPASDQDSGRKWPASLAKWDQSSSSWRTHQFSLQGDLEPFLATWPRWGLMRGGECWEQMMPVHLTSASGSGFWPTPNTIGYRSDGELRILANAGLSEAEFRAMTHRAAESKRQKWLPTPTVQDACNNGGPSQANRNTPPLNSVVGGALNPPWVEWLMGWPIGWTDLQQLETARYQAWLHSHGGL